MSTKPVGEIIKRHNIKYHCYTDDTQVYLTLDSSDTSDGILSSIGAFIDDVSIWMSSNKLKSNKDNIKFIVFSFKGTENLHLKIGSSYVPSPVSVRNLWFILDNILTMEKRMN